MQSRKIPIILIALITCASGCRNRDRNREVDAAPRERGVSRSAPPESHPRDIAGVRCLFEAKPWLNLDRAGDRDFEGLQYRVYLDPGNGKCVHREGTIHVELYVIELPLDPKAETKRTLASDWHYPTAQIPQLVSPILGEGYHVHLRWGDKQISGHDVEIITMFEDKHGNTTRSATKLFRVPKYGGGS